MVKTKTLHKKIFLNHRSKFLTTLYSPGNLILFSALLMVCIIYCFALRNDFVYWDDPVYITENPLIQSFTLANLYKYFSSSFDGHYHPLTLLSLATDYYIAGPTPWLFHLNNSLLHIFNILLVFTVIRQLFSDKIIAVIAAGLFALHPLNVEVVAWATARKDLLYTMFFFLALLFYIRYSFNKKHNNYLLSIMFFLLSVLSKEQAIVLAPVLILTDYINNRKFLNIKVLIEKIPYFIIALCFGIIAILAQKDTGYITPFNTEESIPFVNKLILGSYGLSLYFYKILIPVNLLAYYTYPFDVLKTAPPVYLISIAIIPVIILLLILSYRRNKIIFTGLSFFILNIILLLRYFHANSGDFIIAERYIYIPSIGVFIIIGYGISIIRKLSEQIKVFITISVLAIFIALSVVSAKRIFVWNNSLVFLNDIIKKNQKAYTAYNCRAIVYMKSGKYNPALADLNKAIQLNKYNDRSYANRGKLYALKGNIPMALKDMSTAISLAPGDESNYINRALLKDAARDYSGALSDINQALKINNKSSAAFCAKGSILNHTGQYQQAIINFGKSIDINSKNADAYCGRGIAYSNTGEINKSVFDFNTAIAIDPENNQIYLERGIAYYKVKNFELAINDLEAVIKKDKNNGIAWAYLGFSEYNLSNYVQAIHNLDVAISILPSFDIAYAMRGMANLKIGKTDIACADLKMATVLGNKTAENEMNKYCK